MSTKLTSHYLAPSPEDLTSAQSPTPRWSGTRFSRRTKASRDLLPIRGAHPGGTGRRIACPTLAPARGGDSSHRCPGILLDSSHRPVVESSSWRIPRDFTAGDRQPSHCGARLGRSERRSRRTWVTVATHPASGPRSHDSIQTPAIMSATGRIDAPGVRVARKRMVARPGAGFAGTVHVGAGRGWPRPCPAGKSIDGLAAGEPDHHGSEARREQTQTPSSWHRARPGRWAGGVWSLGRRAARQR